MRYRKKPVEIEAFRIPHNMVVMRSLEPQWFKDAIKSGVVFYQGGDDPYFTIETPEGQMRARRGDYVIRGIQGELYPIKANIFLQTYEPVDDDFS